MIEIVVSYLIVLMSGVVFLLCYKKLTNQKLNINLKKIIELIVLVILEMVNNFFLLKMITGYLILYLLCQLWFKNEPKKTMYYCLIIALFSMISEIVFNFAISFICSSLDAVNKSFLAKNILTILVSSFPYFIFCIKRLKNLINKYEIKITSKISNEVLLYILLFIVNVTMLQYNLNYRNNYVFIGSLSVILVVSILIITMLKNNMKQENLEIKNNYLLKNIENYEIIVNNYNELKHNLNHDLIFLKTSPVEKIEKNVDNLIAKYNSDYEWITRIGNIPKGIQGIICLKLYEAKKYNVAVEIKSDINEKKMNEINSSKYIKLCNAIGILLDNAIMAANKSREKCIYIDLNDNKEILNIKIMNTFSDNLNLDKIGHKNYSTKEIKSGIGLDYLNKILSKEIKIKKEIINNIFIVSLSVNII